MKEEKNIKKCRTCGGILIIRETQRKPSQLKKAYYYTAYYFCPQCRKIYLDDKFKIINDRNLNPLFDDAEQNLDEEKKFDVEIWTDGACVFNGRENARAAWAFVSGENEQSGLVTGGKQTNNVAEGLAILYAIDWAVKNNFKKIKIYSDSQISINNMRKEPHMIVKNRDIFHKINDLIRNNNLNVYFEKVLGHSGDVNNNRADELANGLASRSAK